MKNRIIGLLLFCISWQVKAEFKVESLQYGVGLGYTVLRGELSDYFSPSSSLTLRVSHESGVNAWGVHGISLGLQLLSLSSSDIRKSSKLSMQTLSLGIHQVLWSPSWYHVSVSLQPTWSQWQRHNKLSDRYPHFEQGSLLGLNVGGELAFVITKQFRVQSFVQLRQPELSYKNRIYDIGMGCVFQK